MNDQQNKPIEHESQAATMPNAELTNEELDQISGGDDKSKLQQAQQAMTALQGVLNDLNKLNEQMSNNVKQSG